ncbi:hypothetical protein OAJ60_03775 [Planctomycetaceae bacterium]|nr:hypothetical protein [Planctomycetaceae bacterium]
MSRVTTLGILADRLRKMERVGRPLGGQECLVRTGHAALDSVLPGGGLCRGTLVDWINSDGPGSGAGTLALLASGGVMGEERRPGTLAVVDRGGGFYAVAAASLGVALEQVLVVRPGSEEEWMWAVEQVLRRACTICRPRRLSFSIPRQTLPSLHGFGTSPSPFL